MRHELGPFAQAFLDDLPYDPEVLLFDQLLEVDRDESLVRCGWTTSPSEPITRSQRNHPLLHPSHVSGGLMVHATGIMGFIHAYHIHDLRHSDGWVGYGTHMHDVVFRKLVPPGTVLEATCVALRSRLGKRRNFVRYAFKFMMDGELAYEAEQSAMWFKVQDGE